ncbi:uncharacterized protein LOC113360982 [Papaver somniferum]|uniref:uncharacterized protein LOC113360982 n=1 Tax=Papaver somniferum TaxID=3469 RepID=UPI000E704379|nr:uncharacterized protein LOC113360982 [Papaver somniferum]
MERPEGRPNPLDSPEGLSEEDERDEDENPFHDRVVHGPHHDRLEDRLVKALDLNSGGVKVEVSDMSGRMHAEDFLDWETSIENYFEWKPIAEDRKVLFVKLKLKGMALQWWKKLEEQRTRQGKEKIRSWDHMKQKLRKQFLPPDYLVTLYEKFYNFRQRALSVEEYTTEFYNIYLRVGLNETLEQLAARYILGLNIGIREEFGLLRVTNLVDAYQFALKAEERVNQRSKNRNSASRMKATSNWSRTAPKASVWSNKSKEGASTSTTTPTASGVPKVGTRLVAKCYTCGGDDRMTYTCPQKRVNFIEDGSDEGWFGDPKYDESEGEEEDLMSVRGENLVVRRILMCPRVDDEEEDWRRKSIFRTQVFCGGKVFKLILDDGSCENIVSQEVVDKLSLLTKKHPHPYKIAWFKKRNAVPITKRCLVKFSIGNFEDEVWCDVAPMDACHILLGRPWLFDKKMTHLTEANTYSFVCNGNKMTLHPMKEEDVQGGREEKGQSTSLLTCKQFQNECKETGVIYALMCKSTSDIVLESHEQPSEITELLKLFEELAPRELPNMLPPMRDIQHAIDLAPGSALPNLEAYRMPLAHRLEIRRQVEELLNKGLVKENKSLCVVPALLTPEKDGSW